jgi:hypothetical protein
MRSPESHGARRTSALRSETPREQRSKALPWAIPARAPCRAHGGQLARKLGGSSVAVFTELT